MSPYGQGNWPVKPTVRGSSPLAGAIVLLFTLQGCAVGRMSYTPECKLEGWAIGRASLKAVCVPSVKNEIVVPVELPEDAVEISKNGVTRVARYIKGPDDCPYSYDYNWNCVDSGGPLTIPMMSAETGEVSLSISGAAPTTSWWESLFSFIGTAVSIMAPLFIVP